MATSDKHSIAAAQLKSAPIPTSWIVAGAPRARCAELSRSHDGSAATFVWECTAGEFDWTYTEDETVHILEGEAILDDGSGRRTIQPGDVFLFHAGSTWRWQVPNYVKKVAFLRAPVPGPAMLVVRAFHKLQTLGHARAIQRSLGLYCLAGWWVWELSVSAAAPAPLW